MSIKSSIQTYAESLGLTIGISKNAQPRHLNVFQTWVASGQHAGMAYLSSDRSMLLRADPSLLMDGCRSVLSVAMPCPNPISLPDHDIPHLHGRVAAYAWVEDYHLTLVNRLNNLGESIGTMTNKPIRWLAATDSQPIMEKEFAQQAGLGWAGKNTCLILPGRGSFYLLGELLIDLELEPDQDFIEDRCGTCTRCVDTCPTSCISADRTIDAGRCISYLTIENKGSIPRALRPGMGNWVFGCDICQMVCPWNRRFAPRGFDESYLNHAVSDLVTELGKPPAQFKVDHQNSPILRAKRRGFLRNVCVVLGNLKDSSTSELLQQVLENDDEPLIRCHAAWALGQIGGKKNFQFLDDMRKKENDSSVNEEILFVLENRP